MAAGNLPEPLESQTWPKICWLCLVPNPPIPSSLCALSEDMAWLETRFYLVERSLEGVTWGPHTPAHLMSRRPSHTTSFSSSTQGEKQAHQVAWV